MRLRVATRRSNLALTQMRAFTSQLTALHPHVTVEEVHVTTLGDRVTDRPLAAIGGKGLFISEVEACVSRGEADFAVHSLKDVPGDVELADGMALICLPEREDPRDVLLTRDGTDLMSLTAAARVGTTSLRRVAQLRVQRPDLHYATLRGNVETRLAKLDAGEFDAIVLAASGLRRLNLLDARPHQLLERELCLPAVGQGTLAIEARADNQALRDLLAPLEHATTRLTTEAERALLRSLSGSCRVPMAGHALLDEVSGRMRLDGFVGGIEHDETLSGSSEIYLEGRTHEARCEEARALGREVAEGLIERGAQRLMREAEAAVLRRERSSN
ncbi:MAG: hydroxymethylbilane synthase [Sandaracinaceae bacterium]|nr:hydroxymethylbilane synthase [Myxococcales bacterium]MCB9657379.1 hydroxymethylbilane synthase [Sandaracinaceae bacterium]